jgi:hypothetical protein
MDKMKSSKEFQAEPINANFLLHKVHVLQIRLLLLLLFYCLNSCMQLNEFNVRCL